MRKMFFGQLLTALILFSQIHLRLAANDSARFNPIIENIILKDILSGKAPTSNEYSEIKSIIEYNKIIRPIGNKAPDYYMDTDETLNIYVSLSLNQVISLDEKNQILTTASYLFVDWNDPRLSWNSSIYKNVTSIQAPAALFWMPDLAVIRTATTNQFLKIDPTQKILLTSNGTTYLTLYLSALTTRCKLNVYKYPFDRQICSIIIGPWTTDTKSFNFVRSTNSKNFFHLENLISHPIWEIYNIKQDWKKNEDRFRQFNRENPKLESEDIVFNLYLERKPLHFMINCIFPCLMLNVIILLAFSLPFTPQIGLCMTSFLTFAVTSKNISDDIPTQSDLPLITLYLFLSILYTLVGFSWFIIVNELSNRKKLPKYLKNLADFKKKCIPNICKFKIKNKENKKTENKVADIPKGNVNDSQTVIVLNEEKQSLMKKCRFCDKCDECQAEHMEEKKEMKNKEELASDVSALNSLFFLIFFIIILSCNLAIWLTITIE